MTDTRVGELVVKIENGDLKSLQTLLAQTIKTSEDTQKALVSMGDNSTKSTNSMTTSVNRLKTGLKALSRIPLVAIASAGASFLVAAKNTIDYNTAITKATELTGINAERMQSMTSAFNAMGVESDTVTDGLADLSEKLGEFITTGEGTAGPALEALGLKAAVLSGELDTTEKVADAAIQQLAKIEDPATRAFLAAELGADGFKEMAGAVGTSTDRLYDLEASARSSGKVLDEEARAKVKALTTGFKTLASDGISTVRQGFINLLPSAEAITDGFDVVRKAISSLKKRLLDLATNVMGNVIESFANFLDTLRNLIAAVNDSSVGDFVISDHALAKLDSAVRYMDQLTVRVRALGKDKIELPEFTPTKTTNDFGIPTGIISDDGDSPDEKAKAMAKILAEDEKASLEAVIGGIDARVAAEQEAADKIKSINDDLYQNKKYAVDNFLGGFIESAFAGKDAFKEFARSTIQQIGQLMIQKALLGGLGFGGDSAGGTGGIGNFLGSFLTGGTGGGRAAQGGIQYGGGFRPTGTYIGEKNAGEMYAPVKPMANGDMGVQVSGIASAGNTNTYQFNISVGDSAGNNGTQIGNDVATVLEQQMRAISNDSYMKNSKRPAKEGVY